MPQTVAPIVNHSGASVIRQPRTHQLRHMPQLIHAMLHPVDMEPKLLAVALNLDRLTSAGREVELMDAKHFLLACYAAVDDEFGH